MSDPTPADNTDDEAASLLAAELEDDEAAERFAAELEARALRDPALCRLVLRRIARADSDLPLKAPCEMTQDELARNLGTDRHALNRIACRALKKLKLTPEIRALKPLR